MTWQAPGGSFRGHFGDAKYKSRTSLSSFLSPVKAKQQTLILSVHSSSSPAAMGSKAIAQKVLKDLDWDVLAKAVVSDEGRRELNNLRRAFDEFRNIIETKFTLKPKPINWALYKEKLSSPIVDIFQKSYESLKIPPYEDTLTPEYRKKHEELMVKVAEQEDVSRREIAKCKEKLKEIRLQKEAIKTMTADEYFAQHPEVKAKFDEEIKNHNWGY